MASLFWTVATSYAALTIDGVILLVCLIVGYFPLAKYLPVVGPYVEAAKLVEFAERVFIKSDQLTGHDRAFSLLRPRTHDRFTWSGRSGRCFLSSHT